jgi:hypothetical protein
MRKYISTAPRILSCFALLIFFALHAAAQTPNPVPYLNQPVLPDSVAPGGPGFTLTVTGSEFVSGAHVNWNGSPRATTFVNATQLTATILASDIAKPSTATITVTNPTPGGGTSNLQLLSVTSPVSSPAFARMDEPLPSNIGTEAEGIVVADFNGDGIPDIALGIISITDCEECDTAGDAVCVYLGVGDGTFHAPNCYTAVADFPAYNWALSGSMYLASGDFNGDRKLDLVALSADDATMSVFLGNGDGTFQPAKNSTPGGSPQSVVPGDFNRDGKLDLIVLTAVENSGTGSDELLELLGNGDGTFSTPQILTDASFIGSVVSGDFNRDGNLDLAFVETPGLALLLGNGDGTFALPQTVSSQTGTLFAADFNNDGKLDLLEAVYPSSSGQTLSVFLGNGDGTFQSPVNSPTLVAPSIYQAAIGDLNGDGNLDYIANDNDTSIFFQLGNGEGTFKPPVSFTPGTNFSGELALGDFNLDGMMDILSIDQGSGQFSQQFPPSISLDIQGIFPIAEFSSTTLQFQDVGLGGQQTMPVTLTNTGSATLSISSISISGSPKPNELTQTNNCGSSLAPNAACTITVTFISLGGGNITASLIIADNASGSPQTVAITAPSDDFVITSNTASTVTVNPGQSATFGIAVSGLIDFEGTVALSCSGAPSGSNCTVSPGSVNATSNPDGAQGTATVTVSTTPNTSAISTPPEFPTFTAPQVVKFGSAVLVNFLARPHCHPPAPEKISRIARRIAYRCGNDGDVFLWERRGREQRQRNPRGHLHHHYHRQIRRRHNAHSHQAANTYRQIDLSTLGQARPREAARPLARARRPYFSYAPILMSPFSTRGFPAKSTVPTPAAPKFAPAFSAGDAALISKFNVP